MKLFYLPSIISLIVYVSSQEISSTSRICQEYTIPVNVTSEVLTPNFPLFKDNFDVVGFVNDLARRDANTTFVPFAGAKNVTASYKIGATICSPNKSNGKSTLLLATHGDGYDRRYWDSGVDSGNYSFADFAVSQGYSVFFYDRLGTGKSSKVSGYNESQALTQLAILQQLTTLVRSGQYTGTLGTPSRVVHIGHSFGSFLTNALIYTAPELSDAAILTGMAYSGSTPGATIEAFGLRIASELAPGKWNGRDNGYLTWVDVFANAATFFYPNSYDEEVIWYTEEMKQPMGAIEILTSGVLPLKAFEFTAPVMVISGEFDFAVCGGDCRGVLDQSTGEAYFPNSTDFQGIIHPGVGHNINFSYNATGAYGVMTDYLKKHGL